MQGRISVMRGDIASPKSVKRAIPPPSRLERASAPPEISLKSLLVFFAVLGGIAAVVFLISFITRPPHLGSMSDRQIKGHERKVRKLLSDSSGIIAGRNTGSGIEVWIFPVDGDVPMLFDITDDVDFNAVHNPYEPAFTYWRMDYDRGIGIDWLQNFVDVINILLSRESVYAESKEVTGRRFIINLDDFSIMQGSKFGLSDDPGISAHRFHAMPSPRGDRLYAVRNYNMVLDELEYGVIDGFGSNSGEELRMFKISRSKEGFDQAESSYHYFSDPLPADDGIYISHYLLDRDEANSIDVILESGIEKLLLSGDGKIQNVFTLRQEDLPQNGLAGVKNLSHLYYADKENRLFGIAVDESMERRRFILSVYDAESGALTPLKAFYRPFRQILVDYDARMAFFLSGDEPKDLDLPVESVQQNGESDRPRGAGRNAYWLCSLDLKSLEVKAVHELAAGSVPGPSGRVIFSSPVLTLSEPDKLIAVSNGEDIFLIDYEGNGYRELPTAGKSGWNLIYAASRTGKNES